MTRSQVMARVVSRVLACSVALLAAAEAGAQSTGACVNVPSCMETRNVVANVSDFRFSTSGRYRVVTATLHLKNKSSRPVILGYVNGTGVAIDDQGNRYAASDVRGIGVIRSSGADTKFALQPGESSDARLELWWPTDPHKIFGTSYTLDLTLREIVPVAATQYRLGEEYALRFAGLTSNEQGVAAANSAAAVVTGPVNAIPVAAQGQPVSGGACGATARCYDAGPFSTVVTAVTLSRSGRHHLIEMNLRFRNATSQPLILAYTSRSSSVVDNLGNRYYWGRAGSADHSVSGIGIVSGGSADPQFVVGPGESRDAKFSLIRFDVGTQPIGTSFTYDVSVEQIGVLPSQQLRSLRQYALHFNDLTPGAGAVNVQNVGDAVNKLRSLFRKH